MRDEKEDNKIPEELLELAREVIDSEVWREIINTYRILMAGGYGYALASGFKAKGSVEEALELMKSRNYDVTLLQTIYEQVRDELESALKKSVSGEDIKNPFRYVSKEDPLKLLEALVKSVEEKLRLKGIDPNEYLRNFMEKVKSAVGGRELELSERTDAYHDPVSVVAVGLYKLVSEERSGDPIFLIERGVSKFYSAKQAAERLNAPEEYDKQS